MFKHGSAKTCFDKQYHLQKVNKLNQLRRDERRIYFGIIQEPQRAKKKKKVFINYLPSQISFCLPYGTPVCKNRSRVTNHSGKPKIRDRHDRQN